MARCVRCGSSGPFMRVNEFGLCTGCVKAQERALEKEQEAERQDEQERKFRESVDTVKKNGNFKVSSCNSPDSWEISGGALVIKKKKDAVSIPISQIVSVKFAEYKDSLLNIDSIACSITVNINIKDGSVYLGFGVFLDSGGSETISVDEKQKHIAVAMYETLRDGRLPEKPTAAPAPAADPVTELKRYKELLDTSIITQEDFDAKKKQLLGL